MKVYLVEYDMHYDHQTILHVCTSRELAIAKAREAVEGESFVERERDGEFSLNGSGISITVYEREVEE